MNFVDQWGFTGLWYIMETQLHAYCPSLEDKTFCNFSFSHSVFKTLELQTRKNQDLFGKGLNTVQVIVSVYECLENTAGKGVNAGNQLFPPFCLGKNSPVTTTMY